MKRKLAKTLQFVNVIAMVILMLVFHKIEFALYLIVIAAGIIALVLCYFLRCPHCDRWPRRGDFFNEYCPGCGKRLDN